MNVEKITNTYSNEQAKYIYYSNLVDTKLLATAGSGKTFCIIHHISYLVEQQIVAPSEVFMLTFSKNAKDDFRSKVRKYGATKNIPLKNVCTIDSFAYKMLGKHVACTIDISLLSYAWMDELENNSIEYLLSKYPKLKNIKMVFVDEAQDLNDIQFRILMRMKDVVDGMTIHMVGDPNQNIYQFRSASDKYLVNFKAHTFLLTHNYRSQAHIVNFSACIRPYNTIAITSAPTQHKALQVTFYAYENTTILENMLLSRVQLFIKNKIPLHKVAILAPTRGYVKNLSGLSKYKGLCHMANLLFHNKIPFKQFYNDVQGNDPNSFEAAKVKYVPEQGHINLMTYTASKGLEWDYVIIIDANAHLISRIEYNQSKYDAERYLLYVACSRPRKNLLIFTKSRYANPWFKIVPDNYYIVAPQSKAAFDFFDESLLYENVSQQHQQLASSERAIMTPAMLLNRLSIEQLYEFDKILRGRNMVTSESDNNDNLVLSVSESRAPFMNMFLAHLYYIHALEFPELPENHHFIVDITNIVNAPEERIIVCNNDFVMTWYFENRPSLSWTTFDLMKSQLDPRIINFIEGHLSREIELNSYTFVDKYYKIFIHSSISDIKKDYNKYKNDVKNPKHIFNMTRIAYAIKTTHYFYIKQVEEFETELYTPNIASFDAIERIAKNHNARGFLKEMSAKIYDSDTMLYCCYDKTNEESNLNIRTRNILSIKDILSTIIIHHLSDIKKPFTEFYTLQLSPPNIFKYTITITPDERREIFEKLLMHIPKKNVI